MRKSCSGGKAVHQVLQDARRSLIGEAEEVRRTHHVRRVIPGLDVVARMVLEEARHGLSAVDNREEVVHREDEMGLEQCWEGDYAQTSRSDQSVE